MIPGNRDFFLPQNTPFNYFVPRERHFKLNTDHAPFTRSGFFLMKSPQLLMPDFDIGFRI